MTSQYTISHFLSGTTDVSDAVKTPGISLNTKSEEGAVGISTTTIEDPDGELDIMGLHAFRLYEHEAAATGVYLGWIAERTYSRGEYNRTGASRIIELSSADSNTLLTRRIMRGTDCNRPAETDTARIAWLLTTAELAHLSIDTYVNLSGGVAMDACDYRGQTSFDIVNDCAQASGKNFWCMVFSYGGTFGLWYDFSESTAYSSDIRISNYLGDVDGTECFYASLDTKLVRDPQRVYSGVYMPYGTAGATTFRENTTTGDTYQYRDTTSYSPNVKTLAKANARADRYLESIADEDDRITTTIIVPNADVTRLRPGHRVQCRFSHLPGYEDWRWLRVLDHTVSQPSEEYYAITVEMTGPGTPGDVPGLTCVALDDTEYPYTEAGTYTGLGPPVLDSPGNWFYTSTDLIAYDTNPVSASHFPNAGEYLHWGNGGVNNCVYTSGGIDYGAGGGIRWIYLRVIGPGTMTIATAAAVGPCANPGTITATAYVAGEGVEVIDSDTGDPGDTLTITLPDGDDCAHVIEIGGTPGGAEFGFVSATWVPA